MVSQLIKGNNIEVLKSLLHNYERSVDLVYIDPPYNTKQDFCMSEGRISTISRSSDSTVLAYSDRYTFDGYLEYIHSVLELLYKLLSEKGTIYLHVDDSVNHYLRIILDEIFGRRNFMNEIARVKCNPKNSKRKAWGNNHDVILVYSKEKNNNIWNYVRQKRTNDIKRFGKVDEKGHYTTVPIHAPGETLAGATGKEWKGMKPPSGRHWRVSPDELTVLDNNGLIEWSKNGNPRLKRYFKDYGGSLFQDVWCEFKDPQKPLYPTQKNVDMLDLIVRQSSNENSIVLDCFCGSGSTLLAASKNGRSFIGIDKSDASIETCKKTLNGFNYEYVNSELKPDQRKAM